jgi:hypothetical protein
MGFKKRSKVITKIFQMNLTGSCGCKKIYYTILSRWWKHSVPPISDGVHREVCCSVPWGIKTPVYSRYTEWHLYPGGGWQFHTYWSPNTYSYLLIMNAGDQPTCSYTRNNIIKDSFILIQFDNQKGSNCNCIEILLLKSNNHWVLLVC